MSSSDSPSDSSSTTKPCATTTDKDKQKEKARVSRTSLILWHAHHNDATTVRKLLEEDRGLVQAKDYDNCTPLHVASLYGWIEVAKCLINYGADINAYDPWKNTPLADAEGVKKHTMIEVLKSYGGLSSFTGGIPGRWRTPSTRQPFFLRTSRAKRWHVKSYKMLVVAGDVHAPAEGGEVNVDGGFLGVATQDYRVGLHVVLEVFALELREPGLYVTAHRHWIFIMLLRVNICY